MHVREQWPYSGDMHEYGTQILAEAVERARELTLGVAVSTRSRSGNVVDTLIEESAEADSVVLGSRGLGGFTGLIGGSVGLGVTGHVALAAGASGRCTSAF